MGSDVRTLRRLLGRLDRYTGIGHWERPGDFLDGVVCGLRSLAIILGWSFIALPVLLPGAELLVAITTGLFGDRVGLTIGLVVGLIVVIGWFVTTGIPSAKDELRPKPLHDAAQRREDERVAWAERLSACARVLRGFPVDRGTVVVSNGDAFSVTIEGRRLEVETPGRGVKVTWGSERVELEGPPAEMSHALGAWLETTCGVRSDRARALEPGGVPTNGEVFAGFFLPLGIAAALLLGALAWGVRAAFVGSMLGGTAAVFGSVFLLTTWTLFVDRVEHRLPGRTRVSAR